MNDGKISGNQVKDSYSYGGGVYVEDGTFTMEGGEISGNTAAGDGGGVYVYSGTFTMKGGEISGNTASDGGGVYNYNAFTMEDGTIAGNKATGEYSMGGGVVNSIMYNADQGTLINEGIFMMTGGTISGNKASMGGGVVNTSTFTMSGSASIENNVATAPAAVEENADPAQSAMIAGGGVFNVGAFTMSGGTIAGNKATGTGSEGGGVYVMSEEAMGEGSGDSDQTSDGESVAYGTFTMSGGSITNNSAEAAGGGVYVGGSISVSGAPVITDNTVNGKANNVYLPSEKTVNTANTENELTEGASIGITLADGYGRVFAYSANETTAFVSDRKDFTVVRSTNSNSYTMKAVIPDGVFSVEDTDADGDYLYVYTGEEIKPLTYVADDSKFTDDTIGGAFGEEILFSGPAVAYESNTDAGTAYMVLTMPNTSNFTTADGTGVIKVPFTISPKVIVLEWNVPTNLVYDGAAKTLSATATELEGEDECTVEVTLTGDNKNVTTGGFYYEATGLSNSNYKLPENAKSSVQYITPKTVTVNWTLDGGEWKDSATFKDSNYTVAVSTTDFVAADTGVSLVLKGADSVCNANTYTLTAEIGGDTYGNYKLAEGTANKTFTITKATPSVTGGTLAASYGDLLFSLTPSGTATFNGSPVAGSFKWGDSYNDTTTVGSVGPQTFNATFTPTSENFNAATVTITVTVNQKTVNVDWTLDGGDWKDSATFKGAEFAIAVNTGDFVAGDDVSLEISGAESVYNADDYKFTAKLSGTAAGNYILNGATAEKSFTVEKAVIPEGVFSVQDTDADGNYLYVYDGTEKKPPAYDTDITKFDDGALGEAFGVEILSGSPAISYESNTDAGTAYMVLTFADTSNFTTADGTGKIAVPFTITPKTIGIRWSAPASLVYSGSAKTLSAMATELVEGDSCTVTVQRVGDNVNVTTGGFYYRATGVSNTNYALPANVQSPTYHITKASVSVKVEPLAATYGDLLFSLTPSGAATFGGKTVAGSFRWGGSGHSYDATTTVGSASAQTFYATFTPSSGNFKAAAVAVEVTVENAALRLGEIVAYSGTYDGTAHAALTSYSAAAAGGAEPKWQFSLDGETYADEVPELTDADTYTVYYIVTAENHNSLTGTVTVTIAAKVLDVTWSGSTFTYNGAAQAPTASAEGIVAGDAVTFNYTYTGSLTEGSPVNAGSYTVTAASGNSNYLVDPDTATASFTISPMTVDVAWTLNGIAAEGSGEGYKNERNTVSASAENALALTFTCNGEEIEELVFAEAGTYALQVATSSGNYALANAAFTLTVKDMTVADNFSFAAPSDLTYSGTEKQATVTTIADFAGLTLEVVYSSSEEEAAEAEPVNVGTYYVFASVEKDGIAYGPVLVGEFTIERKEVEIPAFAGELVANGEQQTILPEGFDEALMTIEGNTFTEGGEYTATVSLKDTANYVWADGTDEAKAVSFTVENEPFTAWWIIVLIVILIIAIVVAIVVLASRRKRSEN